MTVSMVVTWAAGFDTVRELETDEALEGTLRDLVSFLARPVNSIEKVSIFGVDDKDARLDVSFALALVLDPNASNLPDDEAVAVLDKIRFLTA